MSSLRVQIYNDFKGVDFTDDNTSINRSPDSLNMWKNYKVLGKKTETRPGMELYLKGDRTIFGLFFYTENTTKHLIIHEGVKLYDYNTIAKTKTVLKSTGMNLSRSTGFIFNNVLYIKDGLNYLEYDGLTLKEVAGYIPTIAIHNHNDNDTKLLQEANLLTDYCYEEYITNGIATEFRLSQQGVNDLTVWDISGVNDAQITTGFTSDLVNGVVTFDNPPIKEVGKATIKIKYAKSSNGRDIINKCHLATTFDNRVFMAGNQDYPNMLIWSGVNNPRYIGTSSFTTLGTNASKIMALVPGNNALWSFKEPSQENTTIFYSIPVEVYDGKLEQTVKTYATSHSSITTGCISTGINFDDDIVFFSGNGMEGISSDITKEQVVASRSSFINRKLVNEDNYQNKFIKEWDNYLLVIIDNKVYLADRNEKILYNNHIEYEWFYWELEDNINFATVEDGILYLGSKERQVTNGLGYEKYTNGSVFYWFDGEKYYDEDLVEATPTGTLTEAIESNIYMLTNKESNREIYSYWTTKRDNIGFPQMQKTTNKRGFKSEVSGEKVKIEVKIDDKDYKELGTFKNTKGYVVCKIKEKKWNKIQFRFSSDKPFGLYETVLEVFVGGYVKRS